MVVQVWVDGVEVAGAPGDSLFECAERASIRVPTSCLKRGKCRECLVEIAEGTDCLTPPAPEEEHLDGPFRLSCRARVAADTGRVVCHTLRRGAMKIEDAAGGGSGEAAPCPLDPAVTRRGRTVYLDGEPIAESIQPLCGLAVDLGTTTVVVRLVDLESGNIVATQSFENPQRFGGSDVLARISYDTRHKGRLLQRTLLGYLRQTIEVLPVDPGQIYEVVVAGNTTMRDLFFGLNVHGVGQKPYRSLTEIAVREGQAITTALSRPARKLLLPLHPRARVVSLPLVASHVGADIAAGLLAVGMGQRDGITALMDIGTNTELVLKGPSRCLAASCPAGPAFEGGALQCGMPALDGAIERVRIDDHGRFVLGTIGDRPAEGLCGSGLIDLLGELLRTGRMRPTGRLGDGTDRVQLTEQVCLTEADISALAQAKAANAAGLRIVFDRFGIGFDDLDVLYLAGGFARAIDLDQARRIGLIPPVPDERIVQVGNTCIAGATRALLSVAARREAESLVRRIEHVELETHPGFFDAFVEGCQFQPLAGRMPEPVRTAPDPMKVDRAELARLLQWPVDRPFEAALERAVRNAETWYREHGRPWTSRTLIELVHADQTSLTLAGGTRLECPGLAGRLAAAGARRVAVIGVSAGGEVDDRIRQLWPEAPDEAMVQNAYSAAVAELLLRVEIRRLCVAVAPDEAAVLPHHSPGYQGWDLLEQGKVFALLDPAETARGRLTVNELGALTPQKSMLAVVGLVRGSGVAAAELPNPCRHCSFSPCRMRRVPYDPASTDGVPRVPVGGPPAEGRRRIPIRALERWSRENLRLQPRGNGDMLAVFSFQGSSCRNEAFDLLYEVILRPEADGYRIRSAACRTPAGRPGLEVTCEHRRDEDGLVDALGLRHPLVGSRLADVPDWDPDTNPAGCLCTPANRDHKWRLVFQTIHYKLG